MRHDPRHADERLDIIEQGRSAEKTAFGRIRRPRHDLRTLALDGAQEGGFLAADIAPVADVDLEVKGKIFSADARTEPARRAGLEECRLQDANSLRIFDAHINISLRRADRISGEDHALDERVRIILHDVAIDVGASIALIGVGHHIFGAGWLRGDGAPFATGGKTRATPPPQSGSLDGGQELFGGLR